jgi:hypothetical protein
MMKRITQILASILFVITVLTVYLAFDFAISNAVSHKTSPHKRVQRGRDHDYDHDHNHNHNREHDHPHDDIKITKKRSITPPVLHHTRKSNHTIKHHNESEDHKSNERRTRNLKQQQQQQPAPHRGKPGSFHKGKTGVKVNKPPKSIKEQRKRLSTTTIQSQHKYKHNLNDNEHI